MRSLNTIGVLISLIAFLLIPISPAYSQTMSNDDYILQQGNLNSFSGTSTGKDKKITFTSGQTGAGTYSGDNYTVKAGFQNTTDIQPFTFSISNNLLNFGTIKAGEPITRTNSLTIKSKSSLGYQVIAQENHELQILNGAKIQDTTCDTGVCTQTNSAQWTSPLVYGFGYTCDNQTGADCQKNFKGQSMYKQFSNESKGEASETVMSGELDNNSKKSQITYKVNIPENQPAGVYQNVIKYIAVPSL